VTPAQENPHVMSCRGKGVPVLNKVPYYEDVSCT